MVAHKSLWRRFGDLTQTTVNIPIGLRDAAKDIVRDRRDAGDRDFAFNSLLCQALLDYLKQHMTPAQFSHLCYRAANTAESDTDHIIGVSRRDLP